MVERSLVMGHDAEIESLYLESLYSVPAESARSRPKRERSDPAKGVLKLWR